MTARLLAMIAAVAACSADAAPDAPAPAPRVVRVDAAPARVAPGAAVHHARVDGIVVDAELTPLASAARGLREGDDVRVRFTLRYEATGAPVRGGRPAAWLVARGDAPCARRISGLLSDNLLDAPAVDLNAWHVVVMNDDASLSIVDPRFGFGGSRLLAMVRLPAPAADWLLSDDGRRLYVAMPDAGRVAVVDTATWQLAGDLDVGGRPGRLVPGPDGAPWIPVERGLVALEPRREVALAAPPRDVAWLDRPAPAVAFVAERGAPRVAVVDLARGARVAEPELGVAAVAIATSPASQLAYAVGGDTIVAIDRAGRVVARIVADDGLAAIRFTPDGRYALIANPATDRVHVLDASTNQLVGVAHIPGAPERIAFSDTQAYVQSRTGETLHLISLAQLGRGGALPVGDIPTGQAALGAATARADAVVAVPGENAVLVANAADRAIYFYKEGMAAPMGSFATYGRQPRAVLVVDRALQERAPGAYDTIGRLGPAGRYDLAFYLDAPRLGQCFEVAVAPRDPDAARLRAARAQVTAIPETGPAVPRAGAPLALRFRVTDGAAQAPRDGATDVRVLALRSPGVWQQRRTAVGVGHGVYQIALTPPEAGVYQFFVEAPSLGVALDHRPELTLRVGEAQPAMTARARSAP